MKAYQRKLEIREGDSLPQRVIKTILLHLAGTGVLLFVLLFGLVCASAAIYQAIDPRIDQELTYVTSLFFMMESFSTVGYGDFPPQTTDSRAFIVITCAIMLPLFYTVVQYIGALFVNFLSRHLRALLRWTGCCRHRFLRRLTDDDSSAAQYVVIYFFAALFSTIWAAIYSAIEPWSFGTSVYFTLITAFTIGYGDVAPVTQTGQGLWILLSLTLVPFNTILISMIGQDVTGKLTKLRDTSKTARRSSRPNSGDAPAIELDVVSNNAAGVPEELLRQVSDRISRDPNFSQRLSEFISQ